MEIKNAKFYISSPNVNMCPQEKKPEYAFIGRSNVGKSSLINLLTNQLRLAKVSGTPGKTIMINHFLINCDKENNGGWFLVDLPGYGYAKRSQSQRIVWQKMIEEYFKNRENLVTVFVLIDSRHEPQKNDIDFITNLGEWKIPFSIIFTKTDKVTQAICSKNIKQFLNILSKEWEFLPRTFKSSTVKRTGQKEILNYIQELNDAFDVNFEED